MSHSIQPLHPSLVALQTATGAVTFLVTRHPAVQLEHFGMQLEVAHRLVVTTPHADRIANELRIEFADAQTTTFCDRPYFLADWEDVVRVIGEFDAATGRRLTRSGVSVGDAVWVDISTACPQFLGRSRRGEVTGISGRRYLVRLDDPIGDLVSFWAPRKHIKPVIRAAALVGAAA
jgi:hypothetical protein